jgi:hypothetical protein
MLKSTVPQAQQSSISIAQLLCPIILAEANMVQLSAAITALALAVSSVEASCYSSGNPAGVRNFSGITGGGRSEERNHVKNMCKGYTDGSGFHRGALQDVSVQSVRQRSFQPANHFLPKTYFKGHNESPLPATVCVNLNDNKKLIVQVTNMQDNGRNLSQDECNGALDSEVFNCFWGGESIKWGWKFRSVLSSGPNCNCAGLESMLIGICRANNEGGRC